MAAVGSSKVTAAGLSRDVRQTGVFVPTVKTHGCHLLKTRQVRASSSHDHRDRTFPSSVGRHVASSTSSHSTFSLQTAAIGGNTGAGGASWEPSTPQSVLGPTVEQPSNLTALSPGTPNNTIRASAIPSAVALEWDSPAAEQLFPLPGGIAELDDEKNDSTGLSRLRLELTMALAFVLCNMDKVNLSVAIIPMAQQLGWSASTSGLVQASFFWGYALTQLPGGWLAQRLGGESLLKTGVLAWSLATALMPAAASISMPLLLLSRFLVGLGEGLAPAAATDAIARNVPQSERSRAVSLVFSGFSVGSVTGLVLCPVLMELFGWESVFYLFGGLGLAWCALYNAMRGLAPATPTTATSNLLNDESIPWKAIWESTSVRALMVSHFCHDWAKYGILAWLPTFYTSHLHLTLAEASVAALGPPLGSVLIGTLSGQLADRLVETGKPVTQVRRLFQVTAFLAPALAMAGVWALDDVASSSSLPPSLPLLLLTAGLSLSSASLAGLYCSHQDISPRYSSILLGLSNTAGALPGFLGVALTGVLYDLTGSWNEALFLPSILVLGLGAAVWVKWVRNSPVDFHAGKEHVE